MHMKGFNLAGELTGFRGLMRFAGDPLGRLETARRLHGTRVFYKQWGIPFALLMDPEIIEELLLGHAQLLKKDRFTAQLSSVLGQGLVTSEGELWRRQRKLLAPSFQPKQIARFSEVMVERTIALLEGYADGQTRDVHADMMRLTLDIVVRTLFGSRVARSDEVDEHLSVILNGFHTLMFSWRAAFPTWMPFRARRRVTHSKDQLERIVDDLIQQKRPHAQAGSDLLSRLICATDEQGQGMGDRQLRDEALTVFLAGHETTALALAYALYCLAKHPRVRTRLESEVDQVVGRDRVSIDHLERLQYCRAVVKETMRLYPPVWAIGRWAQEPFELLGTPVAADTQFVIPQWVVHREARWFEAPLEFEPARWLSPEQGKLPRFAYFPFGGGSRVCIGNHFAMLEATLALATIVQRVALELPSAFQLEFVPTITLRPRGPMNMHVRGRGAFKRSNGASANSVRSFDPQLEGLPS